MKATTPTRRDPAWTFAALPTEYRALCCGVRLPRPLRTRSDYRAALAIVETMAGHDLTKDQDDYLDALTTFIEAWEDAHESCLPAATPLEMLRSLMDENGLTGADLARLLGVTRSLASRLLSGERHLTLGHIAALGTRFRLHPAAFLAGSESAG